eukprot:TRINITY_DN6035_c0_g2_i6.p1 TRINITY_DN6035_c0_g2~~TRINITY_DN6035_c0_g2_i6.p1  ORF type:complete len:136 (+),score=2.19 TRINITY_DN6035_c0_g2_i6:629-1036(+)
MDRWRPHTKGVSNTDRSSRHPSPSLAEFNYTRKPEQISSTSNPYYDPSIDWAETPSVSPRTKHTKPQTISRKHATIIRQRNTKVPFTVDRRRILRPYYRPSCRRSSGADGNSGITSCTTCLRLDKYPNSQFYRPK